MRVTSRDQVQSCEPQEKCHSSKAHDRQLLINARPQEHDEVRMSQGRKKIDFLREQTATLACAEEFR